MAIQATTGGSIVSEVYVNGIRYVPVRDVSIETMPFGQLILKARERKQETLQEAANHIGTTKSHLWTMENGGGLPRLPMLQNVLNYYDLSFDEIELPKMEQT